MFNKIKKFAAVCAAFTLTFVFAAAPVSAASLEKEVEAGKTVTIELIDAKGLYGVEGTISYDNKGLFSDLGTDSKGGFESGALETDAAFLYGANAATGKVTLKATVKSDAKAGDKCVVTFSYKTADENGDMVGEGTNTFTVKVAEKAPQTTPKPTTKPGGGSSSGGSSSGSSSGGSTSSNSTGVTAPAPVVPTVKSDLTELNSVIAIANKLNKSDYTSASWDAFIRALNNAKSMTTANTQADVDSAAAQLQSAIDGLIKIDYTELNAAITAAEDLKSNSEFAAFWNEMLAALANANANLEGTSQEEVDAAAASLKEIVDKINEYLSEMNTQEEPVIVEPEEGVCKVPLHKLLIILLVISLGINAIFGFIIANNAKKRKQDNVPMVDL